MEQIALLNNIFNNINRWLEFSERKNAFVISFFSLIIIFTPFIEKFTSISPLLKISICIFYVFYIITIFFIILSLFPKTKIARNLTKNGKSKKNKTSDNLLFYGDISKYSVKKYKEAIMEKYKFQDESNGYIDDIVAQIVINSNITNNKMVYFKYSVILTSIAMIQFSICFSITLFL